MSLVVAVDPLLLFLDLRCLLPAWSAAGYVVEEFGSLLNSAVSGYLVALLPFGFDLGLGLGFGCSVLMGRIFGLLVDDLSFREVRFFTELPVLCLLKLVRSVNLF